MPTYLYLCPIHGEFEEIHSMKTKLKHCPKCEEENKETEVERLINQESSFILVGGGWFKDGY